jgi:Uma2 family endonuclease
MGEQCWDGADMVIEVVSENDPDRDLVHKRQEYAEAGIPEYWIVDPRVERITVLKLAGGKYQVHGEFAPGQMAGSVLLDGFAVDVAKVFAAAKGQD